MGDYFIRTRVTRNQGARLTYPGFGTFSKRRRPPRMVRNPQTGDPITIPPQETITFSPGQELRSLLNRNGTVPRRRSRRRRPSRASSGSRRQGRSVARARRLALLTERCSIPSLELADLHIHVGGAVAPHILWSIAHDQGFKLPVQTYWEFRDLVTAKPETVSSLADYLAILHHWTEKIQSSPAAIERSVYEIIGKEFRSSGVSLIELRFNPMKRNLGGERDLDHIIHAALARDGSRLPRVRRARGADLLPGARVLAGAERDPGEEGREVQERAASSGSISPGPRSHTLELGARGRRATATCSRGRARRRWARPSTRARRRTRRRPGVLAVLKELAPSRIGHGIAAAASEEAVAQAGRVGHGAGDLSQLEPAHARGGGPGRARRRRCARSRRAGVRYTINTDGPYLLNTHLRREYQMLLDADILTRRAGRAQRRRRARRDLHPLAARARSAGVRAARVVTVARRERRGAGGLSRPDHRTRLRSRLALRRARRRTIRSPGRRRGAGGRRAGARPAADSGCWRCTS